MDMQQAPIGVFDSGVGGLSILKEFKNKFPEYDFLYLGDNARAPYGSKSFQTVYEYTLECVTYLFNQGCDLVILACNTASAKALRTIQQNDLQRFPAHKRVLGVIRPSTEYIGSITNSKNVGILATTGTVTSKSYELELAKFSPEITVTQLACPLWVPLIENGKQNSSTGKQIIREDVETLLALNPKIDVILLGCTHYPILQEYIQELVATQIKVLSQGELVANSLQNYLHRHPEIDERISKNQNIEYLTTDVEEDFNTIGSAFMQEQIQAIHIEL